MASSVPPRPSSAVYWNDKDAGASWGTSMLSASPPRARDTVAPLGWVLTEATSRSPSGSTSFSSTGRVKLLPGRTPYSSSMASGLVSDFCLSTDIWSVVSVSESVSSWVSSFWVLICSQLSMTSMFWFTRTSRPVAVSLRTIRSRLVRNARSVDPRSASTVSARLSAALPQVRT